MFSRSPRIILVVTLLIFISLACSLTGSEDAAGDGNVENVIATSVAATIAAKEGDQQQDDDSIPAQQPTLTAEASEPNFTYAGVSFAYNNALAENIVAGVNPAEIIENNFWNTPEHRVYRF